jgi:hypothetical protein
VAGPQDFRPRGCLRACNQNLRTCHDDRSRGDGLRDLVTDDVQQESGPTARERLWTHVLKRELRLRGGATLLRTTN